MFQLATILLTLTDAVCSFLFLKQPWQITYPMVVEKMLLKGKIVGLHQAKKTTKEIAEITGTGL